MTTQFKSPTIVSLPPPSVSHHTDLIGSEAQQFIISRKGGIHLIHDHYVYRSNLKRQGRSKNIIYWECVRNRDIKCRARLKSIGDHLYLANRNSKLSHSQSI